MKKFHQNEKEDTISKSGGTGSHHSKSTYYVILYSFDDETGSEVKGGEKNDFSTNCTNTFLWSSSLGIF